MTSPRNVAIKMTTGKWLIYPCSLEQGPTGFYFPLTLSIPGTSILAKFWKKTPNDRLFYKQVSEEELNG